MKALKNVIFTTIAVLIDSKFGAVNILTSFIFRLLVADILESVQTLFQIQVGIFSESL
jgi:hypothetical protein